MLTLLPKGVQTKYLIIFDTGVNDTDDAPWAVNISESFLKKSNGSIYSGSWGKQIPERNLTSIISWHCPFQHTHGIRVGRHRIPGIGNPGHEYRKFIGSDQRELSKVRWPVLFGVLPSLAGGEGKRGEGGHDISFVGSCKGHAVPPGLAGTPCIYARYCQVNHSCG